MMDSFLIMEEDDSEGSDSGSDSDSTIAIVVSMCVGVVVILAVAGNTTVHMCHAIMLCYDILYYTLQHVTNIFFLQ